MDIRNLIGMPLRYAISALREKNMAYTIERTVSRGHFFPCEEGNSYVIRVKQIDAATVCLLVNDTMKHSDSVSRVLQGGETQV